MNQKVEVKHIVLQFQKLLDTGNLTTRTEQHYLLLCLVESTLLFYFRDREGKHSAALQKNLTTFINLKNKIRICFQC